MENEGGDDRVFWYLTAASCAHVAAVGAAALGTVLHSTPFVSFAIRGAPAKRSHDA